MGKMKQAIYEHELCDPDCLGRLIQLDMEFEDTNGIFHPSGSIYKIVNVQYDPPLQIPYIFLEDEWGRKCMQTAYDLPIGTYRILPDGRLTDVLYRK